MQKIPFEEVNVNYEIIQYWRPGRDGRHHDDEQGRYSVAVRRPDGEIEVKVEAAQAADEAQGALKSSDSARRLQLADSMIVGMSSLMYSASFYEDEEEEKKKPATKEEEEQQKAKKEKTDRLMMYGTVTFSVVIAVVLFLMVPYFLSELLHKAGAGTTLTAVAEAFVRVALFLGYLAAISRMEDIQRVFMYTVPSINASTASSTVWN